ncbi:MAG: DegT/DnrJ/EryC1/StrS family aminotransferase [Ignavibacteriae bacterium]|nr:DegT/DnrJ/EryC1/StrS family aminotransferase [Ignavibacteriota bacterium]
MNVPFFRYEYDPAALAAMDECLRSGWLTTGPKTKEFEQRFADAVRNDDDVYAVAVNSCTAALHLALEAVGVRRGEIVLVPTHTFAATAEVVRYFDAIPVFVDIDSDTMNISVEHLAYILDEIAGGRAVPGLDDTRRRVRAILPVHYGGQPCDLHAIHALAARHGCEVIEDAAHAFPAALSASDETGGRLDDQTIGRIDDQTMRRSDDQTIRRLDDQTIRRSDDWTIGRSDDQTIRRSDDQTIRRLDDQTVPSSPFPVPRSPFPVPSSPFPLPTPHSPLPTPHSPLPTRIGGGTSRVTCFSFYANKTITTGEGGMATTTDAALAERMRLMSLHGMNRDPWNRFAKTGTWDYQLVAPGFKYNLTDIASALGLTQLARAEEFRAARQRISEKYNEAFADLDTVEPLVWRHGHLHAHHLYVLKLRLDRLRITRAEFIEQMKARGIICSVHWRPLHMHPYYVETYGYHAEDFPQAAALWPRIVSLPLYPSMSDAEFDYVRDAVRGIVLQSQQ